MRIDLHTHTTASDGTLSPRELVRLARQVGVGVLGITDHDTVKGVAEALDEGARAGVEVVPGVELSTDVPGTEVHILGYFVDWEADWFAAFLSGMRRARLARAREMVRRLNALGVPITFEDVVRYADGAIGRPHVARALVERGHVATFDEAFDRYIGRHGPAYVERPRFAPEEAVQTIRAAAGVPVLAHPLWGGEPERIEALVGVGLMGIEAYYPEHTPSQTRSFVELGRRLGLVLTGGSDYHGPGIGSKAPLGSQYVPPQAVEELRKAKERVVSGGSSRPTPRP
ncbi:MAG: PHP domain-containing protein [Armatimonadota bacterium]|nr:PHP domain-containing protein [Armatimonadota bacterium]MDR5697481.1 PHP domain-containing protein [Armatimonadota bacterium]